MGDIQMYLASALLLLCSSGRCKIVDYEGQIFTHLRNISNPYTRPPVAPGEALATYVAFSLARVAELDEKNEVLTTFGWMVLVWHNPLYTWNVSEYGGINKIVVPSKKVWVPEIASLNSVEDGHDLALATKFRVTINADGTCMWAPGFRWSTSCTLNLKYFPFDTQICYVNFTNWMHAASHLHLKNASAAADIGYFEENGSWDLKSAKSGSYILAGEYPVVYFSVELERRPLYYVWNFNIPVIIMSLMSMLVFLLPSEAGEKVSLQITVLLGYTVLMLMVMDITPKSSFNMPLLGTYTTMCMGLTAATMVLTVLILGVFNKNPQKPPAQLLQRIIINGIGSIVCYKTGEQNSADYTVQKMKRKMNSFVHHAHTPMSYYNSGMHLNEEDMRHMRNVNEEDMRHMRKNRNGNHGSPLPNHLEVRSMFPLPVPELMMDYYKMMSEKEQENARVEKNRAKWQHMARILDRFFLLLFLCVFVIMSLGIWLSVFLV